MSVFLKDIKHAFRLSSKDPGFTVVAVIIPLLGICINTTAFSVVTSILLVTAALACLMPAIRATKIDPIKA